MNQQRDIIVARRMDLLRTDEALTALAELEPERYQALLDGEQPDGEEFSDFGPITEKVDKEVLEQAAREIMLLPPRPGVSDHLAYVSDVRSSIHLRAIGRESPLDEFHQLILDEFTRLPSEAIGRRARRSAPRPSPTTASTSTVRGSTARRRPGPTWSTTTCSSGAPRCCRASSASSDRRGPCRGDSCAQRPRRDRAERAERCCGWRTGAGLPVRAARARGRRVGVRDSRRVGLLRLARRQDSAVARPVVDDRRALGPVGRPDLHHRDPTGLRHPGIIPWWIIGIIVARDVLLALQIPLLRKRGITALPVLYVGKAATFALMSAFPWILFGQLDNVVGRIALPFGWALLIWGIAMYLWTFALYWYQTIPVVTGDARHEPNTLGVSATDKPDTVIADEGKASG